ncbi:MAG: hypothetical protein JSW66_13860 [Phycisphaerales bacterium]|nr:MAG: hypothetical protein JSW66_13860 [Phycisphaerales bacterium]
MAASIPVERSLDLLFERFAASAHSGRLRVHSYAGMLGPAVLPEKRILA